MIPLSDMLFFGGFVAAALLLRANREAHKRLMLMAYVSVIVAAVARFPGVLPLGPLAFARGAEPFYTIRPFRTA